MLERKELIDAVIEQIQKDIMDEDTTAIWELLSFIPKENLIEFLPEEKQRQF